MSTFYGLFKHDVADDEVKALFGRYKTHATQFATNGVNKIVGYAMHFNFSPWEYDAEMMDANYEKQLRNAANDPKNEKTVKTKKKKQPSPAPLSTDQDVGLQLEKKTEYGLGVLNDPGSLFVSIVASGEQKIATGPKRKYVSMYYAHARAPLIIDAWSVFSGDYDVDRHRSFVEMVNRLFLENGVTSQKNPVKDILDYYGKVSLLRLSPPELKKVSAVYPDFLENRESSSAEMVSYGGRTSGGGSGFDDFSAKVKKAFADVKSYFDRKFEQKSESEVSPTHSGGKIGSAVKVTCNDEDICSIDAVHKDTSNIRCSEAVSDYVNMVNTTETTPLKYIYPINLRKVLKNGMCKTLARYLCKIYDAPNIKTIDMKNKRLTFRLSESDEVDGAFMDIVKCRDTFAVVERAEHGNQLLVTTTFESVLYYYFEKTFVIYPERRLVMHAIVNGIQMYSKTKDAYLKTRMDKYTAYLHGAFFTITFKSLRRLVERWVASALKMAPAAGSYQTKDHSRRYRILAEKLRKLRSDVKLVSMNLKPIVSKSDERMVGYYDSFKQFVSASKVFSKKIKETSRGKYSSAIHLACEAFVEQCYHFQVALRNLNESIADIDSMELVRQNISSLASSLDTVKKESNELCGFKLCVGFASKKDVYNALMETYDLTIDEQSFISLFEHYAKTDNLDESPKILKFVKSLEDTKSNRGKKTTTTKKKSKSSSYDLKAREGNIGVQEIASEDVFNVNEPSGSVRHGSDEWEDDHQSSFFGVPTNELEPTWVDNAGDLF